MYMGWCAESSITQNASNVKLVFFCKKGLTSFLNDITEELSKKHQVRKVYLGNDEELDVSEHLDWADICWFEWCDEIIAQVSHMPKPKNKKYVCRLHGYESWSENPHNVNWKNVDKLIVVAEHTKNVLRSFSPHVEKEVEIAHIPNGVNMDKFKLRKYIPENNNFAYVGYIHSTKNPMLLLHLMKRLVGIDNRNKLYVAGFFQDPVIKLHWDYFVEVNGLKDNIFVDGWVENIDEWLLDKKFLISTTIRETFGYGIAEAMARGIKPIIYNFPFSKETWDGYTFNDIEDALRIIHSDDYRPAEYRNYILENFSLEKQIKNIEKELGLL